MIQKQVAHIVRRLIDGEKLQGKEEALIWEFLEQINVVPPMSSIGNNHDELPWTDSGKPLGTLAGEWTVERLQLQAKHEEGPTRAAQRQKEAFQRIAVGAGDVEADEIAKKAE